MEQSSCFTTFGIGTHTDAVRLVDHCADQYDAHLRLEWSRRPWTMVPEDDEDKEIAGREGFFVHATFHLNRGRLNLARFWRDYFYESSALNHWVVLLIMDGLSSPSFTFTTVDDAKKVNDVIGAAFDAVITSQSSEA